jgi:hypothetical protein
VSESYKGKLQGRNISNNGHKRVAKLPRVPLHKASYWLDSPNGRNEHTHQLFRFPAKFHPPVVRWALGNYGRKGSVLFDPFTGSGTGQVEAILRGISSVGIDIDPLACFIAKVKTTPVDPAKLQRTLDRIRLILSPYVGLHADREVRKGSDISEERFQRESISLNIPPIPNIVHWFRRYVIVDLARILWAFDQLRLSADEKRFFRACVASIIRGVSNADPAPVSGLEVTSIQAERNRVRTIKVVHQFFSKVKLAISGMAQLWIAYEGTSNKATAVVISGDVLQLDTLLGDSLVPGDGFPLVITSPPYCRAVEYSRRHQLEMYWMGFIKSPKEQIKLAHTYVGRKLVRETDWDEKTDFGIKSLDNGLAKMTAHDPVRARGVRHYFHSMAEFFEVLAQKTKRTGTVVCVIGNSKCCDVPIPTADILAEIASERFTLNSRFSYALRNHYMQYGLWNGDGIKQEHVLILKPR